MDYVKYTVDNKTTYLESVDGQWVESLTAPTVAGSYNIGLEISRQGAVSYLDSNDSRLEINLKVQEEVEQVMDILQYLPEYLRGIEEFKVITDVENRLLNTLSGDKTYVLNQMFIDTAGPDTILRWEHFLGIKGEGSLEQRKSYVAALLRKGEKLSEQSIKAIVNTLTGSESIVTFYTENDVDTPKAGHAILLVQVLSPDSTKDYKYDDIERILEPLTPAHIDLMVIKYFATWEDVMNNYTSWATVGEAATWQAINDYIPPM